MAMQYPFILPCPICGETPKTYEHPEDGRYKAICPNCGFDFDNDDCDEPATVWNNGVKWWYKKQIPPKQCPKCGRNEEYDIGVTEGLFGYYTGCTCRHAGPFAATIPAALVAWNKQPEPESVTTQDKKQ